MMILSQSYSFSCFVAILFSFLVSLISHTLASPTLQRDALLEFKNEFPIVSDLYLSSWNKSIDHCSWKGVTCDGKYGEVISLVLDGISLNGSLKSNTSLFKLQHLRHLRLTRCELIGEIPSSLGNLSHLIDLDLYNNHLTGEIPTSIGDLNQLKYLSFMSNNLTGEIPFSLGNLSRLTDLWLSFNHLVGEVPTPVGNLNQLTWLDLSENQFSGGDFPRILQNMTTLSRLDLSNNHIKSKLPTDMSVLQNLEQLDVSRNSFFGNFPTSLLTIPSLGTIEMQENKFELGPLEFEETSSCMYLDLSHNNLNGPIPDSISRLVNLSTLDLSHNSLIGKIPKSIYGLVNLNILDLSHNSLIGTIPRSMSKLASLSQLDLSYNKLEGQIPSFLWSLDWLSLSHNSFSSLEKSLEAVVHGVHFDISSNSVQGVFPQWICNSTSLDLLDLSNNRLTGSIPSCLKNSTASLTYMNLSNNNFTGALPNIFIDATAFRSLDVSHNQLVGRLPKSLMNCSKLEFLNLEGNNIKDTFPSWLQSLGSLGVLLLGSNAFYGSIYNSRSTYFGFPTLRVIDISHNSFSGALPPEYFLNWFEMSSVSVEMRRYSYYQTSQGFYSFYMDEDIYRDSMHVMYKGVETEFSRIFLGYKAIDFSGNKFKGWIPKSIGMLKGLRLLNLSGNAFTGTIPSALENITNLEALDLSRNKLSGQIPHDLGNLSFLSYLDFSHNLLHGPVPRGTQFQRQNCSSFEDNLSLYGLEDICGKIHVPDATSQQSEDSSSDPQEVLNWIAATVAYIPGVFCGLVIGHIFTSHKQEWFTENLGRIKLRGS